MVTMVTLNAILTGRGVHKKFNHILADTYHILLILVPNKRLGICLSFHDLICKLPNSHIHEYS